MTTFAIMMNNLEQDNYLELVCQDCGKPFEGCKGNYHKMKRCPECRDLFEKERKRPDKIIEHDPYVDLVLAVIDQTRRDLKFKKKLDEGLDPREFIQNGGVQLWLRSIGIGVRPSMTKQIERMLR
jgi:predicted amidophosphoribosyltransferase